MANDKLLTRRGGRARVLMAGVLAIALIATFSVSQALAARVLPLPRVAAETYQIDFEGHSAVVLRTLLVRRIHGWPTVSCNRCPRFAAHKLLRSSPSRTSRRYRYADWILSGGRAVKIKVTRRGWIGRYLLLTAQRRTGRLRLGYKASGCLSLQGTQIQCPGGITKPAPTVIVVTVPVTPPTTTPVAPPAATPPAAGPTVPAVIYGPFNIRAVHSGKCLDVFQAKLADVVPVQQYQCLGPGHTNQQWYFAATGDGLTYYVKARHSGKCLDVFEAKMADGVPVQQYQCLGYAQSNQRWYLTHAPIRETFNLRAAHSNLCADVTGGTGATGDEIPVQQYQCLGASQTNQQWYVSSP
jgi:hypothetical protein